MALASWSLYCSDISTVWRRVIMSPDTKETQHQVMVLYNLVHSFVGVKYNLISEKKKLYL